MLYDDACSCWVLCHKGRNKRRLDQFVPGQSFLRDMTEPGNTLEDLFLPEQLSKGTLPSSYSTMSCGTDLRVSQVTCAQTGCGQCSGAETCMACLNPNFHNLMKRLAGPVIKARHDVSEGHVPQGLIAGIALFLPVFGPYGQQGLLTQACQQLQNA